MDTRSQLLSQASEAFDNRDFVNAHKACVTLIRNHGDDAAAQLLEGKIHIELAQLDRAIECLERSIGLGACSQAYVYLAKCHSLRHDPHQVAAALANVAMHDLADGVALREAALACARAGLADAARPFFKQALQLNSDNAGLWYEHGLNEKHSGQYSSARMALEKAIELKTNYYAAHYALSALPQNAPSHHRLERLEGLLKQPDIQKNLIGRLQLGHAVALEYEKNKQYDKAFQALTTAKARQRKAAAEAEAHVNAIYDWLMDSVVDSQPQSLACQSPRPLFIVGMPSTGITLVEKILTSHSLVARGSQTDQFPQAVADRINIPYGQMFELPHLLLAEKLSFQELGIRYLQRTEHWAQENKRLVTDSFPFNFFYMGLIRRAFPNAKIICLMREPLDTCVSNYLRYFAPASTYQQYSYDLIATGRFYKQFCALMNRWQQHSPDAVRLQSYEALVRHPLEESQALLEFCSLPAETSLNSALQALALNDNSIGKWKHYEAHLGELETLLSE